MQLLLAAAAVLSLSLSLLLPSPTAAHNITRILEKDPDFSTFNHYLTVTQLAPEINRRETITVCAVDNAAMSDLLSKHLSLGAIKNVLSLHVLLDYFDAKKLHQITDGTALAAPCSRPPAPPPDPPASSTSPTSRAAKSASLHKTTAATSPPLSSNQSTQFPTTSPSSRSLLFSPPPRPRPPPPAPADQHHRAHRIDRLLPRRRRDEGISPKFKNLTAAGKQSLLEYHGIPIYQSIPGLKSSNGITNTLATDGASKFSFDVKNDGSDVTIFTKIVTAKIVNTLVDEQPLAIYQVNKVLMPEELFKGVLSPSPAPAPGQRQMRSRRSRRRRSISRRLRHRRRRLILRRMLRMEMWRISRLTVPLDLTAEGRCRDFESRVPLESTVELDHPLGRLCKKVFTFNKVYGTTVTQQHIYADTQAFVRSVMDGFNVCIFCIRSDRLWEDIYHVNYRALRDLFQSSKARMDLVEYEVGVQMVEIYNEQIRNNSQLNGLNVPDASLVPVKCTQDVLDLMRIGQRNRAVGATALNVRSSRSHSILTVHVRGKELVSGSMLKGCLHLVDLAGSERVDKSEAVGERLKEAQHINKSLSALGDVIAALAQKSSHIPYRNSKLTQVLQDSLGGHAKTLMFVHINPEVNALGETISTLKFAERVATINLGAAQSNKETGEIKEFKDEISNLKLVLERKEAELEQLKNRTNVRGGASPLRLPKSNSSASLKAETSQQQFDSHNTELRSSSTGKQRRSRLPSKFTDKDCGEDRPVGSIKPRSPSPPSRRSISTDRAAVMKSRTKSNALDNPPVLKAPFPASLSVNKSNASVPSFIPGMLITQEPNLPNALNRLHRVTLQRVPENEDELFKQALSIRHGGIRKTKQEGKVKTTRQQASAKVHTSMLLSDVAAGKMQETIKPDSSEPENENGPFGLTRCASVATGSNKLHRSLSRNSQNVEPSEISRTTEPSLGGQHSSVPQLRRSKSTTLGRFMI
ncbi:hypothetical protein SASPL_130448 [Salvia splendens]|uniref:Kinesin motor domain-containing protein n=1 Tax=Salvia splendens TaxID=180675 RepID=A0A8X8ZJN5_SALSN|nr:hypothetical protein SASPL_130448 [Salvia splendens]